MTFTQLKEARQPQSGAGVQLSLLRAQPLGGVIAHILVTQCAITYTGRLKQFNGR